VAEAPSVAEALSVAEEPSLVVAPLTEERAVAPVSGVST
jgi:hypothetical protein